jgi:hypothetical protein
VESLHSLPSLHCSLGQPLHRTGNWTDEENAVFTRAFAIHGADVAKLTEMIPTRSLTQCRTHAIRLVEKANQYEGAGGVRKKPKMEPRGGVAANEASFSRLQAVASSSAPQTARKHGEGKDHAASGAASGAGSKGVVNGKIVGRARGMLARSNGQVGRARGVLAHCHHGEEQKQFAPIPALAALEIRMPSPDGLGFDGVRAHAHCVSTPAIDGGGSSSSSSSNDSSSGGSSSSSSSSCCWQDAQEGATVSPPVQPAQTRAQAPTRTSGRSATITFRAQDR